MSVWAIVVAAGSGTRFGRPKQFEPLGDKRLLDWSIDTLKGKTHDRLLPDDPEQSIPTERLKPASDPLDRVLAVSDPVPLVDGLVVVVPAEQLASIAGTIEADFVVAGGPTRSASVRAGLGSVPTSASVVVVHDAARPFASASLYDSVIKAVTTYADAAVPGLPVVDTIKRVDGLPSTEVDSTVAETVDRSHLVAVQTPQAFRADALRKAHEASPEESDDGAVIEAMGGKTVVVLGEESNFKVTRKVDLIVASVLARL